MAGGPTSWQGSGPGSQTLSVGGLGFLGLDVFFGYNTIN